MGKQTLQIYQMSLQPHDHATCTLVCLDYGEPGPVVYLSVACVVKTGVRGKEKHFTRLLPPSDFILSVVRMRDATRGEARRGRRNDEKTAT